MKQNASVAPWGAGGGAEAGRVARGATLLSPGTFVAGKYIICDVLGTGGAAVVYAAEQVGLKRVVAFKLYPVWGAGASVVLARFEREAQLLARVRHENVVAVFDAGKMPDGSPYLVVQRLEGESLAARLLAGPLSVTEAVEITRQVLSALCALRDAGIVHGDLKPGNIVLDRPAPGLTVVKLVDFGIARDMLVASSPVLDGFVGTPRYMAPEQMRGEPIDMRCDLYALGATLYEMLTGRTPHTGESVREIARSTLFGPITPVRALREDCPEGLAQIVMRALARDPCARFGSAREMKFALERWLAGPGARARSVPVIDPEANEDTLRIRLPLFSAPRARKRRRRMAALACAAALAALSLAYVRESRPAATQAPGQQAALQTWQTAELSLRALTASASELLSRARAAVDALVEAAPRTGAVSDAESAKSR